MKVKDLVTELLKCPQGMDIELYYDGAPRLVPDFAYLKKADDWKGEVVVLGEYGDIYNLTGDEKIFFNKSDCDPSANTTEGDE